MFHYEYYIELICDVFWVVFKHCYVIACFESFFKKRKPNSIVHYYKCRFGNIIKIDFKKNK